MRRELAEETGLSVATLEPLLELHLPGSERHPAFRLLVFRGFGPSGTMLAGDDADEVGWFGIEEMQALPVIPSVLETARAIVAAELEQALALSGESSARPVPCSRQNHSPQGAMVRVRAYLAIAVVALLSAAPGRAAGVEAPFEQPLMRLAEVLGSLHYLRNLCGETGNQWRDEMERLLASENPQPERRARFVASFNRGYRSFDGVYVACTASATEAISRYMKEGEALSRDIATRYGN